MAAAAPTVELDHVEYLDRVVGVLLGAKLHKPVPLVRVGHPILGQVDVDCRGGRVGVKRGYSCCVQTLMSQAEARGPWTGRR